MSAEKKIPTRVTFVLANYSDFVNLQEPVQHRSVTIELTPEQRESIRLRMAHGYESVSLCFVEDFAP